MVKISRMLSISLMVFSLCFLINAAQNIQDVRGTVIEKRITRAIEGKHEQKTYLLVVMPKDNELEKFENEIAPADYKKFNVGSKVIIRDKDIQAIKKDSTFLKSTWFNVLLSICCGFIGIFKALFDEI